MPNSAEINEVIKYISSSNTEIDPKELKKFVDHYSRLDGLIGNSLECHFMIDYNKDSFVYISDSIEEITGYSSITLSDNKFPFYTLMTKILVKYSKTAFGLMFDPLLIAILI